MPDCRTERDVKFGAFMVVLGTVVLLMVHYRLHVDRMQLADSASRCPFRLAD